MAISVATLVGATVETTSDGSLTVPNTTAPSVGDLLVAFIGGYAQGGSRNLGSTPSGWTLQANLSGDEEPNACYTKVADSGDVSAGTFGPFALSSTADVFIGVVVKVTNYASIADSEIDSNDSGSSITATTNLTATTPDSILLAMYFGTDGNGSPISIGTYVSTPSLTWSEVTEQAGDNGTQVATLSVAAANNTGTGTITSRGATASSNFNDTFDSIAILINSRNDATGTNATFAVSPLLSTQNGVAGVTATNLLHTATPTMFDQSGKATTRTAWTNEAKATTTWTNETL